MKDDKKLTNHEEYTPKKEDFVLVQKDVKIYDQKMDTKTTTFARDAFKRFCKNKSSVVGAIIIGLIMLLAIIVPFVSPYDINNPDPDQSLLPPKLFEAGTGWWDGTKKYENVVYNTETKTPQGFVPSAVLEKGLHIHDGEKINISNADQTSYHGTTHGGYYKFIAEPSTGADQKKRLENRKPFDVQPGDNLVLNLQFGNIPQITDDTIESKQSRFKVSLVTGREGASSGSKTEVAVLSDWGTDYSPKSYNISEILGDSEHNNLSVRIELERQPNVYSHLLIEKLELQASGASEEKQALLTEMSIIDPCTTFFLKKNDLNQYPTGYYSNNGLSSIYQANITLVDFIYDVYEAQMGLKTNFKFGGDDMDFYIQKGWVKMTDKYDVNTFELVKEYEDISPVISVSDVEVTAKGTKDEIRVYTGEVYLYRYKADNIEKAKMPIYLLGTTATGYDLIKLSFVALRTSLLIAIITSAICLAIGLCWGSISGYFGGNVDLFMERITDILANIPFIVVMTLTILVLGNNIGTFALALCLTSWIGVAARTRTQFYRFKGREYILASRTLGASDGRLIFKHILPNALGTIVTSSVLMIPGVIFSEASISYLGLGLQGVKSFGVILSENQQYLSSFPSLIVFPALIISLLMISFNLFGNGLRDALNPSLKGSE